MAFTAFWDDISCEEFVLLAIAACNNVIIENWAAE